MTRGTARTFPSVLQTGGLAPRRQAAGDLLRRRARPVYIIATALTVTLVWQLLVTLRVVPVYMLPAPPDVVLALWEGLSAPMSSLEAFIPHIWHTIYAALLGLAIGAGTAVVLSALCAINRVVNELVRPYVFGLQSMPKIALAPLLMVWFGFGDPTKVALAALLVFFPVFVNSYSGFTNLDPNFLRLFRSMGANRWQLLFQLRFPAALVPIFAGLEMGIVRAQLGAVVAEFLAGQDGVGVILLRFQAINNTAGVFAIFIVLGVTSVSLYYAVKAIKKYVIYWLPSNTNAR